MDRRWHLLGSCAPSSLICAIGFDEGEHGARMDEIGTPTKERLAVLALSQNTAAIQNACTGNVTIYSKANKPAYGPLGDSLDDLTA
jgi:hypothetical protein